MMKITDEHSKKIEALISEKTFTLQDIISLLDNLYTDNQIKYHINKFYPESKNNLIKEYSKGGTKLEYILKEIFPYDKIEKEFSLGERLRVDFVIKEPYNLAFEFDGIQHEEYSSFFHGSKGAFQDSIQRDEKKELLLKNRGINLIRLSSLQMNRVSLETLISLTGYGAGTVEDESLLTFHEKKSLKDLANREKIKQLKKSVSEIQQKQKVKNQQSKDTYKSSLKEKQKEYRKQQYQKQKEWIKNNKTK